MSLLTRAATLFHIIEHQDERLAFDAEEQSGRSSHVAMPLRLFYRQMPPPQSHYFLRFIV